MRRLILAVLLTLLAAPALAAPAELAAWKAQAARVQIVRDDWGIAHITGKSDADAVFGLAYAQAEDDFNRVETNFVTAMGRTAEAEGQGAIWLDLRMKLFIQPAFLKAEYARSPAWLKALMNGWAAGLNYYLAVHPEVTPKVIKRFEPWMALSFSEGSIGGDIERVSLSQLEAFYGKTRVALTADERGLVFKEPTGSNGFVVAPSNTRDGHALLMINPHTSFFFRSEVQVTSGEGLNAYGAVTWGQFFIYQGFNAHAGWMHTSSAVDVIDEFAEDIVMRGDKPFYRYGGTLRPVRVSTIVVPYKAEDGSMASRSFTTYATHHGPIVREASGKWISVGLMNTPRAALEQSFLRTKTRDYASYMKVAALKANSSNNTLFADDKGEIAYLHPQFIPKRDDRFDWLQPVDGSDPAADWKGLHALSDAPHMLNPKIGFLQNVNDWPYSMAGPESPRIWDFPKYMDTVGETPRTVHALRVLTGRKDFTLEGLIGAAYDPYLPAFAKLVPVLVRDWEALPAGDPAKARLAEQVALLKGWDYRWGADSTPTSLAVFWGDHLFPKVSPAARAARVGVVDWMAARASSADRLAALAEASDRLVADFGSWKVAWGEINRFQRLTGDIVQPFDDAGPSIAVPFVSSQWGSLASFGARRYPGTKKYYGTSGNSFVAAVEFGPRVRALAVSAGGESGDPNSPHFNDQAGRYAAGRLREVYFYPDQLKGHTERTYQPGE